MLDPSKRGVYPEGRIISTINKLVPDSLSSVYLSLDIEGDIYNNMMKYDASVRIFKESVQEFIRIVRIIKSQRPKIKVGIYGVPFRFFYSSQKKVNDISKFSDLFKEVDFISPSLYLMYPDKQIGINKNREYIESNLQYSLELGDKFAKPVIPYIWYLIHPSNRKYGGSPIEKQEFEKYIKMISSYRYNGKRVFGMMLWEPSDDSFNKYWKQAKEHLSTFPKEVDYEKNALIKYYLQNLLNN